MYDYYDKFDPHMHGRINVGASIESGKNMNMLIGGNGSSFNPNESKRMALSFCTKGHVYSAYNCFDISSYNFKYTKTMAYFQS